MLYSVFYIHGLMVKPCITMLSSCFKCKIMPCGNIFITYLQSNNTSNNYVFTDNLPYNKHGTFFFKKAFKHLG